MKGFMNGYLKKHLNSFPGSERGHHPPAIMDGITVFNYCEQGIKAWDKVYQETVWKTIMKPFNNFLFQNQCFTFLRSSAAVHKAKTIQTWFRNNLPDFICFEDWLGITNCGQLCRLRWPNTKHYLFS